MKLMLLKGAVQSDRRYSMQCAQVWAKGAKTRHHLSNSDVSVSSILAVSYTHLGFSVLYFSMGLWCWVVKAIVSAIYGFLGGIVLPEVYQGVEPQKLKAIERYRKTVFTQVMLRRVGGLCLKVGEM